MVRREGGRERVADGMEELCERLDARTRTTVAGAGRGARAGAGEGTSSDMSSEDVIAATTPPEESEEVREKHRRLLAEIRSCFRLLSIHSRLSGSESPRTRRISTQTDSCESLHSLATERAHANSPRRVLRGLSQMEDAQNSLLYNQLIIGSTSGESTCASAAAAVGTNLGQGGEQEPHSESIHQRPMVNPTSRLKTVIDLSKADVIKVIEWLYRDHPGAVWRAASREAMEDQENSKFLIYGEVSFVAFAKLLEQYAPQRSGNASPLLPSKENKDKGKTLATSSSEGEDLFPFGFTFYDLGCGAGRPVYMASLLNTNCTKSCGIEIVSSTDASNLYSCPSALSAFVYKLGFAPCYEVQPNLHPVKQSQELGFLYGDFLQIDWSDADMIFTNATCFGDPLFRKFEERAAKVLKPGAIVISVTRFFIDLEPWELLESQERQMSWAPALVFVYRKKGPKQREAELPLTGGITGIPSPSSSPEPIAQPAETVDKGSQASPLPNQSSGGITGIPSPSSSPEPIAQPAETVDRGSQASPPPHESSGI